MEFGNVFGNYGDINFVLPNDPQETTATLLAAKSSNEFEVHVGGTKWADKSWLGTVYPPKTKSDDFLKAYSQNFNTIEFGPTFYNIYKVEELNKWKDQVTGSPDFRFLPKFPQIITHIRRFVNADESTKKFYESLTGLGNHVGPLLLQIQANISPSSFPQLKAYLESLPSNLKVAVEVRHKDWFLDVHRTELCSLLKRLNISWAITDAPGRRDCVHMTLPTADAIIRFVGATPDENESNGSETANASKPHEIDYARIDNWVERLKVWKDQGLQSVWFFVHHQNEKFTPLMCDYFIQQLNLKLGVDVKRPTLL
jgi:uncharacterized protein YecE (DUF72 family)